MPAQVSITDLQVSPEEDLRKRMRLYTLIIVLRVISIIVFFFVPGWWKLIPATFAVFSNYVAVTIGNAVGLFSQPTVRAERPVKELR